MSRYYNKPRKWVVKNSSNDSTISNQDKSLQEEKKKQEEEERKLKEEEERKRKEEEEEKRKIKEEEERIRREEEEKERQKEELLKKQQEEIKSLEDELSFIKNRIDLRTKNDNAKQTHLDSASLRKLNASLQKNTAFIKKLSKISNDNQANLLKELRTLNLSKYTSEVVNAISSCNFKSVDIDAAVLICSEFHQLYSDFTELLIPSLSKVISSSSNETMIRKRNVLRLLTELYIVRLYKEPNVLLSCLKEIMESKDTPYNILQLVLSFVRSSSKFMLNIPINYESIEDESSDEHKKKISELTSQINKEYADYSDFIIVNEKRTVILNILRKFYDKISALLQKEHQNLRKVEKTNQETFQSKGELTEEMKNEYAKILDSYNKLKQSISNLASLLNFEMVQLPEESVSRITEKETQKEVQSSDEKKENEHIWDDDDMYKFYEVLPDLKEYVNPSLLGIKEQISEKSEPTESKVEDSLSVKSNKESNENQIETTTSNTENEDNTDDTNSSAYESEKFKSFLVKLNNCVNRDLIDNAAIDFCYMNKKSNRRKLVSFLFNVSRTKLEILPYFSRFVAILYPYMSEIGKDLVARLEDEFNTLYAEKDQINVETKIKNIRFLSELVKFKVCPPNIIFNCLKMCLDDFKHHNIDIACNLLETCGRFLYKNPATSMRANHFLEMMKKLKDSKNFTSRQEVMIENAYYACRPPERQASKMKTRTPIQQYIYNLIYEDLSEKSFSKVLKQLRKINWERDGPFLFKCITKIHNGSYEQISNLAGLVAGLSTFNPLFCIKYVDHTFEALRVGLEEHDVTNHQNLFMITRLIGELYAFKVIDENALFETLYTLIRFGHQDSEYYGNPRTISVIDPPHETFRVRLVCNLLDCTKNFFNNKKSNEQLKQFLMYFQRYILMKITISIDLKFNIDEIFQYFQVKQFKTFDEANDAIRNLEEQHRKLNPNFISIDRLSSIPFNISKMESITTNVIPPQLNEDEIISTPSIDSQEPEVEETKEEDNVRQFEEEFDKEFEMLVSESRDQRKKESAPKEFSLGPILSLGIGEDTSLNKKISNDKVKFHVIKKGSNNKPQTAILEIPKDSSFVKQHLKVYQEEREKQEQIKRLTLKLDSMEREQRD